MKKILTFIFIVAILPNLVLCQDRSPLWKTLPEVPVMPKADESGFAPVNGINLYYAVFNKAGKNPVVLLHGGLVSSDIWGFEVPLLMKTHQVIVVDSRGHGRSSMTDQPFTYQLMTDDVLKTLDFLKVKKASMVGWSDGGIIGMLFAIGYPERINKLFTYGAGFDQSGDKTEVPDSALSAKFLLRAKKNYQALSATPDSFVRFRHALGKMYSTEPNIKPAELKTIHAPTMIVYGEYEQFTKAEHFEKLATLIPGAKLVMMPNVSHGGPLQDPGSFHRILINFLDH